jgi:hypothetical protein
MAYLRSLTIKASEPARLADFTARYLSSIRFPKSPI